METSKKIRVNTATTCPGAPARANYRFCVFIIMERAQPLPEGGRILCVAIRVHAVHWWVGLLDGNLKCPLLCTCYWIRGTLGCQLIGLSTASYIIVLACPWNSLASKDGSKVKNWRGSDTLRYWKQQKIKRLWERKCYGCCLDGSPVSMWHQ